MRNAARLKGVSDCKTNSEMGSTKDESGPLINRVTQVENVRGGKAHCTHRVWVCLVSVAVSVAHSGTLSPSLLKRPPRLVSLTPSDPDSESPSGRKSK